jgi:hypothetical protein
MWTFWSPHIPALVQTFAIEMQFLLGFEEATLFFELKSR